MEQIFREDLIWLDETFEDKDQFFDKIGKRLCEKGKVKESFADGLKSREAVYPTGLKTESYEIAIPHTDVEHVREASISFVRFKETVLFSHMGEPEIQVNAKFAFVLGVKEPSQQVEVLSTLTDREQKVLRLRFGLDDGRARTLEEVGKEFNVTRERIR